jgi:hypothetical protein
MLKPIGLLLCLIIFPVLSLGADQPAAPNPCTQVGAGKKTPDHKVLLSRVMCEVEQALKAYQQSEEVAHDILPPLNTVDFQFTTTIDHGTGVELDFFIFKLNASRTKETINQVDFQYTPECPPQRLKNALTVKKVVSLQEDLLKTIRASAQAVKDAQATAVTGAVPMDFNQLTVTLSYGVTWTGSFEADIPISIVTLSPSVNRSKNDVQQVTLTFTKPSSTPTGCTAENTPAQTPTPKPN